METGIVENEFFHADGRTGRRTDGRTDMTKLIVAFRNFTNAPKIVRISKRLIFKVFMDVGIHLKTHNFSLCSMEWVG